MPPPILVPNDDRSFAAAHQHHQLRRHFSRFISEAEQGRTFVITRRGRDVAVLTPARRFADDDLH